MIEKLLVLSILVCSSFGLVAAEAYRWEDAQGKVHYSDQPPPADARNIRRTNVGGEAPGPLLPYQLQVAVSKFPVSLYVTDCGAPCDKARALLIQRGVPHTLLDASKRDTQEALKVLTGGQLEVPVAQVGKTVLRGFETGQWNAALDAAGYPSEAMITVTPTVPQARKSAALAEASEGKAGNADSDNIESEEER